MLRFYAILLAIQKEGRDKELTQCVQILLYRCEDLRLNPKKPHKEDVEYGKKTENHGK